MIRRMFIWISVMVLAVLCVNGCKKKSDEPIKSQAEYKAEAKEQIDAENMESELDKLESELEQDISIE